MGIDVSSGKVLQFHQAKKAFAKGPPGPKGKSLFVEIDGRLGFLYQYLLLLPGLKKLGGTGVFVAEVGVSREVLPQDKPDDVIRVTLVEVFPILWGDDVIGWAYYLREVLYLFRVIP